MPSFWEGVTRFLPSAQDLADAADEPPPRLPPGFEWCRVDLDDPELLRLLQGHYVDADGGRLRLLVTREMLEWTLGGPGRLPGREGVVGVRATGEASGTAGREAGGGAGRLVACISCTPAHVLVDGRRERVGLISHMCVHRKLRNKRLTPVLVREVTRVGWAHGLASGLSTSARRLHAPLLRARYHQRVLDADALVRSGFLPKYMAPFVAGQQHLEGGDSGAGARPLRDDDVPWAAGLLSAQAAGSRLALDWSDMDGARHRLLPRGDTVFSYVIGTRDQRSLVSFYAMPVRVLDTGAEARMAYLYAWSGPADIETLLAAAARLAAGPGRCHMLSALDIGACTPDALRRAGFSPGADNFFHAAHCAWGVSGIAPADSCLVLP